MVVMVLTGWVSVTSSFCSFMRGHQRRLCFVGKSTQSECDVHLSTCNMELLVLRKTDLNSVVYVWRACFFLDGTCVCVRLSVRVHHVCARDCVWLMDDGGVYY